MGIMDFDVSTIIWNIVNVLVFFGVLKFLLWKPVIAMMEKRQQMIEDSLQNAEQKNSEAEQLKLQYEDSLKEAKTEAAGIIEKAKKRSQEEREIALKQTKDEAAKLIDNANKSIEAERAKAMQGMQNEIASIAMAAAQKVITKNVDDDLNNQYLDNFIQEAGGKE